MARRYKEPGLLIGAQVLGQLSLVIVIPFLTRVFSPSELGYYQIALAMALILQPVATLRLEFVIPVSHRSDRVRTLFRRAMLVTGAFAIVLLLVSLVARLVSWPELSEISAMTAMLLVVNAWTAVDNARLIRGGRTGRLAARNLLAGVLAAGLQFMVGIVNPEVVLLAFAVLVGRGVAILVTVSRSPYPSTNKDGLAETPYGWRRAMTTVVAGVISNSSIYGLTLLVGAMFSSSVSGQVGTAQRITSTPISFGGQAFAQYFQAKSSAIIREGSGGVRAFTVKFLLRVSTLGALVCAMMVVLGPILAVPVLGPDWQLAGSIIAVLALPTALQLVVAPTVPLFVMLGREKILLRLQTVRLAASAASGFAAGISFNNAIAACAGFAIATVLAYLATVVVTLRIARAHDRNCD